MDIIRTLRSRSPWKTPTQFSEKQNLKDLIAQALRPASKDDRAYWVGRFLQHFPGRNTTKDAVMISDISMDLAGISHYAIVQALGELRREANKDNPFLPQSGDILKRANEIAESLKVRVLELDAPEKQPIRAMPAANTKQFNDVPWANMDYTAVVINGLIDQVEHHCQTELEGEKRKEYGMYLSDLCGWPKEKTLQICRA